MALRPRLSFAKFAAIEMVVIEIRGNQFRHSHPLQHCISMAASHGGPRQGNDRPTMCEGFQRFVGTVPKDGIHDDTSGYQAG